MEQSAEIVMARETEIIKVSSTGMWSEKNYLLSTEQNVLRTEEKYLVTYFLNLSPPRHLTAQRGTELSPAKHGD
jgi:hypothetical protein